MTLATKKVDSIFEEPLNLTVLTEKSCVSLNSVQGIAVSDLFHMFTQSIKFSMHSTTRIKCTAV